MGPGPARRQGVRRFHLDDDRPRWTGVDPPPFDGAPLIYDAATGARRHELTGHLARVAALAFGPDGTTLVTASTDGAARIWNTATGALLSTFVR